ncbi:BadF/BadG/BcrA/BcrD ATPase family protein [Enhygromyxa salina]|uniref:Activator of (R)-2-hydroxyglutaryl-CoA dehydratase n=1 Tax=Enhygromyxa salina TaxID=215803 RepID=A0A2S9Y7Y8_9BACT|nr:BadF/BadG/BcrA/BcrD ATPase family protein [Enhygromyxa salina]PRQ01219.1 Activator of (R)-2-hydroxyglutaryl-CoA dehydratase [Enhygromyxa salina]
MRADQSDLVIGMDIGSTTVKAVVINRHSYEILWSDYQRHHTKQPEKVLELLEAILVAHPQLVSEPCQMFCTGSGAGPIAEPTGSKFVQEVNAVTLAVEHLYPDVRAVIELGGQDAKIIVFKQDQDGNLTANASMNDKCASGTGATIDKCMIKVGAEPGFATSLHFSDHALHHVAAKCGVFAETDIVNLIKSGIPKDEVLNSLADAIVLQNLSVLTRGNTLKPRVILLGGPNTYLPFLQECWKKRIPETWRDRGFEPPADMTIDEMIFVPDNAELYAAFGAAIYGMSLPDSGARFKGREPLQEFIRNGRRAKLGDQAGPPLSATTDETDSFRETYTIPKFKPAKLVPGSVVRAVIGLDGGSTSSKAVLVREDGEIVAKAYQLSKGNPIVDAKDLLRSLRDQVHAQGATIECLGLGATGYAADVLEEVALADVNIVETVAHMMSAVHFFGDVDVICDIGGQDIKVLFMRNGDIQGFKLSNSCSAGNGMLLQAMADQFGIPITEYAENAFEASLAPKFSYGCAVFLDTDRVNFQKEGFQKQELLAGLAQVLPKNVWQYVVQIPRMASLGRKFVLQGGTQYNLAAVKAQVDYIKERVPDAEVFVHPHTGEAGAIGAAMECLRRYERTQTTRFIGIDATLGLEFTTQNDESTTCHFCPNECSRTFIDTKRPDGSLSRYISGFSCEKGTVESQEAMLEVVRAKKEIASQYPNMVTYEAKKAFMHVYDTSPMPAAGTMIDDVEVTPGVLKIERRKIRRPFQRSDAHERLKKVRIGMPRVLNFYSTAPFFRAYFESLGVPKQGIVFSDVTDDTLWTEGGRYGSIDPCFPAKVCQAHIHNLLFHKHQPEKRRPLNFIYFPVKTFIPGFIVDTHNNGVCPIVAGTPNVMRAAFTKELDFFAVRDIEYVDDPINMEEVNFLKKNLFDTWGPRLGITQDESDFACSQGFAALEAFNADVEHKGQAILDTAEAENSIAILVLARPYHGDPGIGHSIPEEFQALGYPILSIRSIPKSREYLDRYYKKELDNGDIGSPLEISHVWPENYLANSAQRVWAANFAAHHPNVAILDLSSFKCGSDAPTYGLVDSIIQAAKVPAAALHDLDANKPGGSIKIRVKTYTHSLSLHKERLEDASAKREQLLQSIENKRLELLELKQAQLRKMQRRDPGIDEALEAVRKRVREYVPKPAVETGQRLLSKAKNLVQIRLGRRDKTETIAP